MSAPGLHFSNWGCTFKTLKNCTFKHVRGGVGFLRQNTLIKNHGFRKTVGNATFSEADEKKTVQSSSVNCREMDGVEATMWPRSSLVPQLTCCWSQVRRGPCLPRSDATAGGGRERETHLVDNTHCQSSEVWIDCSCHNLWWEREKLGLRTSRLEVWRGGEAHLFDLRTTLISSLIIELWGHYQPSSYHRVCRGSTWLLSVARVKNRALNQPSLMFLDVLVFVNS